MFSFNLPPALLAELPEFFACYCGNTGVERIPKQESAQKVDPGGEILPHQRLVLFNNLHQRLVLFNNLHQRLVLFNNVHQRLILKKTKKQNKTKTTLHQRLVLFNNLHQRLVFFNNLHQRLVLFNKLISV